VIQGLALSLVVVAACSSGSDYKATDSLVVQVEDMQSSMKAAMEQLGTTIDSFKALVESEGNNARALYDSYKTESKNAQDAVAKSNKAVDSMKGGAESYFAKWNEDLAQFNSEDARKKNAQQLKSSQDQFNEIVGPLEDANQTFAKISATLDDALLLLGRQLNAETLKDNEDELADMRQKTEEFVKSVNSGLAAADEFVKAMAAPKSAGE